MNLQFYIARRILLMIPLAIGVTLLTFIISHVVPSNPIVANLGDKALGDPEIVASFKAKWGLDRSLPEQYFRYVSGLLRGDLGVSITSRRTVLDDLKQYLPATVEMASAAMILSIVVGIPTGVVAAANREGMFDRAVRVVTLVGSSAPIFWLALMALFLLYARLGWFPSPGRLDTAVPSPPIVTGLLTIDSALAGRGDAFVNALWHLTLPATTLGAYQAAYIIRVTRASMLEVMFQDFIRTARAKGLRRRLVLYRHALRNALIPTISFLGLAYGSLLAGAVIIETIFSWPGVGRYALQSSTTLDFPAIMGVTIVIAAIYVIMNLIVDVMHVLIDPRIRVG